MKILLFSWRGPGHPNAGGAEASTYEHAKRWVKVGHKVTLFTSFYPGAKRIDSLDGVKIIRSGRQVFGVHFEAIKWYLMENHQDFDLVIDQFHGIPFFIPLFVRKKKLAFIHEVTKEVWQLNPWSTPFNLIPSILGTTLEPLIFKFLYKNITFMTVSDSTKADLISWGLPSKNIFVVHNGITRPKINRLPPKEKRKTLIFLGAISKDKGIEDALTVFSIINNKEKDWNFWIVGRSEFRYENYLKKLSKKLGLEGKLKFWGFVSERKKFELLAKAHILVNPSIREGWGLVVIEAAAVGTPTVGYNVPGLRDSIQNNKTGILTDSNSLVCAQAILSLSNSRKNYKKMQQSCINWSKKFNWEKSSRMSLELIKRIML